MGACAAAEGTLLGAGVSRSGGGDGGILVGIVVGCGRVAGATGRRGSVGSLRERHCRQRVLLRARRGSTRADPSCGPLAVVSRVSPPTMGSLWEESGGPIRRAHPRHYSRGRGRHEQARHPKRAACKTALIETHGIRMWMNLSTWADVCKNTSAPLAPDFRMQRVGAHVGIHFNAYCGDRERPWRYTFLTTAKCGNATSGGGATIQTATANPETHGAQQDRKPSQQNRANCALFCISTSIQICLAQTKVGKMAAGMLADVWRNLPHELIGRANTQTLTQTQMRDCKCG